MTPDGQWQNESFFSNSTATIIYATCYNGYSPNGVNGATTSINFATVFGPMIAKTKEFLFE
jgi:hypothetical protein